MNDWRDSMRDRVSQKKAGGKFKLVEGENVIRILPNAKGTDESPIHEFRVHRDVGPDERVVACGKDVFGKGDCWLCDTLIPKLLDSESQSKRRKAESIKATDATIAQVAVVSHRTGRMDGPYVWWIPTGGANALGTKIMSLLVRGNKSYEHPSKGFNLNIERTGTGKRDTRYSNIEADENPSRVPGEILDKIKPFEEVVPKYSRSDQEDAFYGRDREDDDRGGRRRQFEDEDRPRRRQFEDEDRPRRSRDDDDDRPRRSRDDDDDRPRRVRDDDDDDDDRPRRGRDDDEDRPRRGRDDDDDDRPRRSRDDDDDRPRRSRDDDDDDRPRRSRDDDDDDRPRRSRDDDDDDRPRRSRDDDDDDRKGADEDVPFDDKEPPKGSTGVEEPEAGANEEPPPKGGGKSRASTGGRSSAKGASGKRPAPKGTGKAAKRK